jgi:hypothetical protein
MIHFITYGDDNYEETKKRLCSQARSLSDGTSDDGTSDGDSWFNTITSYSPDDLDDDFKERFKNILEQPRGGGYWIWKPYIINKHLEKMEDGDILIYLDAGCHINPSGRERFNEYIEMLKNSEEGAISFQMSQHIEKKWTVKEIFEYFNIHKDSRDIIESGQIIATVRMFKKNSNSTNLVSSWLNTLYYKPLLFTDHYNKKEQSDIFIDNRHDQSVLSVLSKLYKTIIIEDETYFAEGFGCPKSLKCPFWATRLRM